MRPLKFGHNAASGIASLAMGAVVIGACTAAASNDAKSTRTVSDYPAGREVCHLTKGGVYDLKCERPVARAR